MNTEQEETTRQDIVNSNIVNIDTSSSTDTSTSSYATPEVSATGRTPLNRGRRSKQTEQIVELQAILQQREEEFQRLQQHVLTIMTQIRVTHQPIPYNP